MMKIKSLVLTTSIAVSGIIVSGAVTPASAFTVFLGEDIGANSNIGAIPNSIATKSSFLSNLTGSATEGFEKFNFGSSAATLKGIIGGSIQTKNSLFSGVSNMPYNGRFAISGSKYYEVGSKAGTTTTFTFAKPIAAFGFYATDLENQEGLTLQLNDTNNTLLTFQRTAAVNTSGSALYYGLIAQNPGETFSSITLKLASVTSAKENDRFGIDNLTVATLAQLKSSAPPLLGSTGTPVPEPLTIVGTLLGSSAAFRMKKKLKSSSKI